MVIERAQEYIRAEKFTEAERELVDLLGHYPRELKIIDSLVSLYLNSSYPKLGATGGEIKALELLSRVEGNFKDSTLFYRLVMRAHLQSKGLMVDKIAKEGALRAAQRCIELDPTDPGWYHQLGYVHYWFDDIGMAITVTKQGLKIAEEKEDQITLMRTKNNLAYYYARAKQNKDKAFEYANSVYEFFKATKDSNYAMAADSLGYVKMQFATKKEELEEAANLFQEAIKLDPEDSFHYAHLKEANTKKLRFPN